jgi:hypothetical protein
LWFDRKEQPLSNSRTLRLSSSPIKKSNSSNGPVPA